MKCTLLTKKIFKSIKKPFSKSHKYQNGLVLIIAGSKEYHGSLWFSAITASRLADLVFVCSSKENIPLMKKISPVLIVNPMSRAMEFAKQADSILIGPGLENNAKNKKLVKKILHKFLDKKTVLDATALHLISPKDLHSNCCVTPHAKEFKALFREKDSKENVFKNAKKFRCIVSAKGQVDFISNGKKLYCNSTGNSAMTKGGTGDTLAGLIAGFAAKNPLFESTLAAFYLNGYAGVLLYRKKGRLFNAEDLMDFLPEALKAISK